MLNNIKSLKIYRERGELVCLGLDERFGSNSWSYLANASVFAWNSASIHSRMRLSVTGTIFSFTLSGNELAIFWRRFMCFEEVSSISWICAYEAYTVLLFYFILFYFILFYFILFYFILFYFILYILFYFILFYFSK